MQCGYLVMSTKGNTVCAYILKFESICTVCMCDDMEVSKEVKMDMLQLQCQLFTCNSTLHTMCTCTCNISFMGMLLNVSHRQELHTVSVLKWKLTKEVEMKREDIIL